MARHLYAGFFPLYEFGAPLLQSGAPKGFVYMDKQNDKPGYVANNHLSRPDVAIRFEQPT